VSFHLEQQHPIEHAACIERDHPGKSNAALLMIAGAFALTAVLLTFFSVYLTFILQWQGPFRDLWEFVDDIEQQFHGNWSWEYLLEAYGGAHRIFLPKLLFFADFYWLGGRNWLTIAIALLCQFFYLLMVIRLLLQQSCMNTAERTVLATSFMLALFSTTQVSNFLYAMDVQWYLSNLFGLICLYILADQPRSLSGWLAVILSGSAAALCNFTGLMTLALATLILLLDCRPARWRWPLFILATVFCLQYVSHDKNSEHLILKGLQGSDNWRISIYILLDTVQKILPYMLRYLASPLSREWPIGGSWLSLIGMVVTLYYWIRYFRHARQLSNWQRLCLYISTCIIASAFFTAFGRIIYPNSATAERYQTLVLPWLPALFGLIWPDIRQSRHAALALMAWTITFGCYLLPAQPVSAENMVMLSQRVNLAHTAARSGVLEPPFISASLSYPLIKNGINSVKDNDVFLRSNTLGYFQKLPEFALDKKIKTLTNLPSCTGYTSIQLDTTSSTHVIDGQLLNDGKPVTDIVLLQNSKVIGLGMLVGSDNSILPPVWQPPQSSRFRAFISADHLQPGETLIALGITGKQVLCSYPVTY
jgi:hypothetical protein